MLDGIVEVHKKYVKIENSRKESFYVTKKIITFCVRLKKEKWEDLVAAYSI